MDAEEAQAHKSAGTGASSDLRNATMLSLGHGVVMVLGGVLALMIAYFFGKNAETDALFTAYGVYGIAVIFGQTLRLTAIPRIVGEQDWEVTDRLLAAIVAIALLAGLPMIAFAAPLGDLLAPNDPGGVAAASLRLLWPAVAGQLVIGLLAATLVVHGRFSVIAIGYCTSGVMSIVVFLALQRSLGIKAIPLALDASSLTVAAMFVIALVRGGWRPRIHDYVNLRGVARDCGELGYASASFVAANLGYVICLAVANRESAGEATIYAYAYFTAALLVATTAISGAMARAPKMLDQENSHLSAASSAVTGYRFTLVVLSPVFALAVVVGSPMLDIVLGTEFSRADASRLVVTMLCLSGWVLGSAASVFAIVHLLNERKFGALTLIAIAQTALLVPMAIIGRKIGIEGVGVAQSASLVVGSVLQLGIAFAGARSQIFTVMSLATLRATVVTAIAAGSGSGLLMITAGDSTSVYVTATIMSLMVAVAITRLVWRAEFDVLATAIRHVIAR